MKPIFLIIVIACLTGCFGADSQNTGKEGKPLPEFSLLLTDSTTWLKSAQLPTGKSFVLLYFSPYCPYCKAQTKEIVEDINKLKDINFYFISNFPMPAIRGFQKEYKLSKYSNIILARDTSTIISDYFEIAGIPYMAIYNKNKKLNKTFMGKIYSSQIKKVAEE